MSEILGFIWWNDKVWYVENEYTKQMEVSSRCSIKWKKNKHSCYILIRFHHIFMYFLKWHLTRQIVPHHPILNTPTPSLKSLSTITPCLPFFHVSAIPHDVMLNICFFLYYFLSKFLMKKINSKMSEYLVCSLLNS